jgi:hypothetical protein
VTSPKAAIQELKDRAALFERIDKTPVDAPELFIVSGDDAETFDQALDRIKARILSHGAGCHVAVFGNEPDDDTKFITEIENVPLFAPYRLIILRDAQQVLAKTLKQSLTRANLKHFIAGRPDRTWIVLHYEGKPGQEFLDTVGSHAVHFAARDLFPEQIIEFIRNAARAVHLQLSDDAIIEIRDRVLPRPGSLERAVLRVKESLPAGHKSAALAFVQEVLFPYPGWNINVLVDSLFAADQGRFFAECQRRDPAEDFARVLKAILNRTDEIRRARVCFDQGLPSKDILELTGNAWKHAFVQKKILSRLRFETEQFSHPRILAILEGLETLFIRIRSGASRPEQEILFTETMARLFFH